MMVFAVKSCKLRHIAIDSQTTSQVNSRQLVGSKINAIPILRTAAAAEIPNAINFYSSQETKYIFNQK